MSDKLRDLGTPLLRRPIRITVSGSFSRHLAEIGTAVEHFQSLGVQVLSPAEPRVVDAIGTFVFLASDRHRSVRLTEDRHLDAIRHSDFLWLVCPDGYVGPSASLELGFAIAHGIPVLSETMPFDITHRQYVDVVTSIASAVSRHPVSRQQCASTSLLVDPQMVQIAHTALDQAAAALESKHSATPQIEAGYSASRKLLRSLVP